MLRIGIVDFDSSHSIEFTRRLNHVGIDGDQCVDGARVVLGCPGSSEMSPERIAGFTDETQSCGVELVDDPTEMIGRIDAVMVLSLSGQVHLSRVRPFLETGIPAYVDKPIACSLDDAREMLHLAERHKTIVFSASALRFAEEIQAFLTRLNEIGPLHGAISYGPAKRAQGNPSLFHYGIHTTEILLTLMGSNCRRLKTVCRNEDETVTAEWADGRVAVLRGIRRGHSGYGFLAFCEQGVIHQPISTRYAYRNLLRRVVDSFETGRPAFDMATTLHAIQFIEASLKSEQSGGDAMSIEPFADG